VSFTVPLTLPVDDWAKAVTARTPLKQIAIARDKVVARDFRIRIKALIIRLWKTKVVTKTSTEVAFESG
jgi:hypothetical protein